MLTSRLIGIASVIGFAPLAPIADDHLVACHYPLERWPMSIAEPPASVQPVESAG